MDDTTSPSPLDAPTRLDEDLRILFETSTDLIALGALDGRFRWLNPRWTDVLGWDLEHILQTPFLDFVHPADRPATLAELERLGAGERTVGFENRYRCADGGWRWLAWNTTPTADGELFCIVRDVTEHRRERHDQQIRLRQLGLAEELSGVGTWRIDLVDGKTHWSDAVYRIHGRDPATYVPDLQAGIEAYHPADRDEVRRCIDEAIARCGTFRFRLRLIRADDRQQRIVLSSGQVQTDEDGNPVEVIGVFQDITDFARAEQELREANASLERRMADLEERSTMMTWMSELGDMLQSAIDLEESKDVLRALLPRIFHGLSGVVYLRDPETGIETRAASWGPAGGAWRTAEPNTCWAVRRGTEHLVQNDGALRCRHLGGVHGASRCVPLMAHGQLVGLLVLVATNGRENRRLEDLSTFPGTVADQIALAVSNVRLRDRLRQQSLRDQLTGLYNRRFFDDWLAKQVSQVLRGGGRLSVAMLDLDHFKRFNDTYGHLVADRLLVRFATLLKQSLRDEDVVCRWGGEEFLLAFPGTRSSEIRAVLVRVQQALTRLELRDDEGLRISAPTLSAGVASFPADAPGQDELLHTADMALYAAKNGGRNRVVLAEELSRSDLDVEDAA